MNLINDFVKVELDKYLQFIKLIDGVKKIYLFGSYAYGEPNKDSDLDLAVIISDDKDQLKTSHAIHKGLALRVIPLDMVVNKESDFDSASERITLQNIIKFKGELLYDVK
ncbi:MAG: nucleotidyltransferase domain-containing protein [Oscillospiraceae bacterium]|nr:nucleotidyltransferase domain-containing protein [Oscillospiraceae bacterium]